MLRLYIVMLQWILSMQLTSSLAFAIQFCVMSDLHLPNYYHIRVKIRSCQSISIQTLPFACLIKQLVQPLGRPGCVFPLTVYSTKAYYVVLYKFIEKL